MNSNTTIPRIIHYCWFGGNEKPEIVKKCMASWKEKCPDFEIKEWNENNFDINMFPYTKEAYENKKWAFVSDVARLWIIYNYGGIYMDTDVEIKGDFGELLSYDSFMFFESVDINTGLGFGAKKNNKLVKAILDDYNDRHFVKKNGDFDLTPCPSINTYVIEKTLKDFKPIGITQKNDNMAFISLDEYSKNFHHFGVGSWGNEDAKSSCEEYKDTFLKRFLRKPSRLTYLSKHLPRKIYRAYVFFAYDFLEYGPWFLSKKLLTKLFKK